MTEEAKTSLSSADIIEIMKLLPHRYPFLLVDRIIEIDGDESAVGIKNVTANEPHFTGHFPESPIMPGVLLIEGMAQTAGAICAKKQGETGKYQAIALCAFSYQESKGLRLRKETICRNIWETLPYWQC